MWRNEWNNEDLICCKFIFNMYISIYYILYLSIYNAQFIITCDNNKIHQNKIHVYNYEGILQKLYTIEEGFH